MAYSRLYMHTHGCTYIYTHIHTYTHIQRLFFTISMGVSLLPPLICED